MALELEVSLALQKRVIQKLLLSLFLKSMISDRIFDRVPDKPTFPYVSIGPDDVTDDSHDCTTGSEVFVQLDVWSRQYGRMECKRIAGTIRDILDEEDTDLDLTEDGFRCLSIHHVTTRFITDQDGTHHGIVTMRAECEELKLVTG